uniref:Phospholipase B-like n=1 Tax=Haemonchus contortus TaxID=6289 RepID=A0A7I4YEA6_HAECO
MRLLLVFLALCAGISTGIKIRKSENYLKDNRVPTLQKEKNPHGTSQFKYEYVSVCVNGTEDNLLDIVYAKQCNEKESQVALGRFTNQVNTTGWGILEIETFPGHAYDVQAYAAGVAEGELTRELIYYHYKNTIKDLCKNSTIFCKRLYKYLTKNLDWLRSQVVAQPPTDLFWRHVNLTFAQMTGIYDSYMHRNLTPEIGFDLSPIMMIQLSGEFFDLNKFLNKTPDPQEYPDAGHCSGFVKLADGNKDMFFAHVAMSSLSWMIRVLKLYKFAFDAKEVPGHIVSFSGYPAQLASADDYTLTSAGLASTETTIAIFNKTLYSDAYIRPEGSVHCWLRSVIANYLTKTPKEWVKLFSRYNSGTYNNQWTVVDFKKFKPGQEIPDKDLLWILEQTPASIKSQDVTWFLKRYRYWPSYNVPFIKDISIEAGFSEKARERDWYKWGSTPRAKIFERDHHKVQDIDSLTKLMRYNDYTHEEFARCKCSPLPYTAEGGISARGDLNLPNGTYEVDTMGFRDHAGLDYKGTNYEMFSKLRFRAWGGPTYDPLPVFDWSKTNVVANHFGQPQVWNFTYVDLEWETTTEILGIDVSDDQS